MESSRLKNAQLRPANFIAANLELPMVIWMMLMTTLASTANGAVCSMTKNKTLCIEDPEKLHDMHGFVVSPVEHLAILFV